VSEIQLAFSPDKTAVGLKLTGSAAAIVATEKKTAMYVDDKFIDENGAPPHIARLNMAMLFLNELERRPDWFKLGLQIITDLQKMNGTTPKG